MSEIPSPKWNCLPDSPTEFFGLDSGFNMEQLKRAYGDLVRRFKPDKFPEEFKKIRAAYEQLERNLRYGQSQSEPQPSYLPDSFLAKTTAALEEKSLGNTAESESIRTETLLRQLEVEGPEQVYRSIYDRPSKSPMDYYALAVLGDLVAENTKSFAAWLVEGLRRFPRDGALSTLLLEQVRAGQVTASELQSLLSDMARSMPDGSFFYNTEPIWHRLLKISDWESFAETLRSCERLLVHVHPRSKAAFYVGLIRCAMWKAPIEWLQQTCRWLEQDSESLHGALDVEYEVYSNLLILRKSEENIRKKGRFGCLILETVQSYCEDDQEQSLNAMFHCQTEIANQHREFLEEFAFELAENPNTFQGWYWISSSVLSHLWDDAVHGRVMSIEQNVYYAMRELDEVFPKWVVYWLSLCRICRWIVYGAAVVVFLVFGTFFTQLASMFLFADSNWATGITFLVLAAMIATTIWLHFRWVAKRFKRWDQPFLDRMTLSQYQRTWRFMIARMFAANHYSYNNFQAVVQGLLNHHSNLFSCSAWLPNYLPHDTGLILYSIAVRFRR